ncbi:endopeptidase [Stigmatella sp. ncwal1]|uniref:Endopeptidase n=1 Tax=Stigmatella ashevillensis TaxID=2995309 RepID=A0ABT5DB75_9BACT|nr:endopeptidase [Stigmatella ashevillena]MDC0710891.1 endopeptidase [Stigmatella ashevillena]
MRHSAKLTACCALLSATASWAIVPPESGPTTLSSKAFFKPELTLTISNVPLGELQPQMSTAGMRSWDAFFARNGREFNVYLDARTGTPTSIQGSIPLIPGDGVGNRVTLAGLRQRLGRTVQQVDAATVADLVVQFIADNQDAMAVDPVMLGEPRVTQVTEQLWQVHIPQVIDGVTVRHSRVAATISHGNLILIGTEAWSTPQQLSVRPTVAPEQAMAFAGDRFGLLETPSTLWMQPTLEVVPQVRADAQRGQTFIGKVGQGYTYNLAWTYGFQRPGELERWKVTVDAQSGEVLSLEDDNHYLDATIKGGIYPTTNIETCADNTVCGTIQPNSPMPWANTGLASPNNYTDGAGVYNYSSGTVTTTLDGKYVKITDTCGTPSFSSTTGNINMGGETGDHDCVTDGGGTGNTAAARSCFYELNKLKEQARGWLPANTWLQGKLTANVNISSTCNAFWNGSTVNFYKSGGGCRNTGEIGAVFDHEWGHGIDNFDANGALSNSSEGYADIAAIYRLQTSCIGFGFFQTTNTGCGQTPDGSGYNQNEAQTGAAWCNTNCSGVRDADWDKHVNKTPSTPANFVCTRCSSGSGPCGKQVHCAASPTRQAAWDFVARDLRAAPFNYDSNTAFLVANKVFYQGSGNVGTWHGCNCTAGTSDGCGATNGYMQWLAADDDNGTLADGTPHMSALYAAFNRHNIACSTPAPVNSGCASGPSTAPAATATPADGQVSLEWTPVSGASQYWVMKTEGFAGCDFGKAKIATVTGSSYVDSEVANGRAYCYSVVAAGSSAACYSPGSACTCVTPVCSAPGNPALSSPAAGGTGVELAAVLDWSDATSASSYDVQVATDAAFTTVVASASALTASTWTVSPALSANTVYYWRVRASNSCGGSTAWTAARTFTTRGCVNLAAPTLVSPATGATGVSSTATLDWSDVASATGYEVQVAKDSAFATVVASGTSAASTWTVSPALSSNTLYYWRVRATDSCGKSAYSSVSSFTTSTVCTPLAAAYNATTKSPACVSGCGCDTGTTLINGRGTLSSGSEPNQPNTLGGTCADGTSGTYHSDESIDRIVIKTVDQGAFAPGKQVTVDVTVWCYGTTDGLDLYYTTAVGAPSWTALATNLLCTAGGRAQTFSQTFTLNGSATGQQAVRAQFRYGGTASSACVSGSYNDRDDLVFAVSASAQPKQAMLVLP